MNEEKIHNMSQDELHDEIVKLNQELKKFGWERGLHILTYELKETSLYKEKQHPDKYKKSVHINYLAIIARESPELITELIQNKEIKPFITLVSQVELCLETFIKKFPPVIFPKAFL